MTKTEDAPMAIDMTSQLAEQLSWHWENHVRPRLEGLTDEEYRWEPAPGAWNIRPRGEATTPMAAGGGEMVADFEYPEPDPAPVTTIAWRMAHLYVGVFGQRSASHFGGPPIDYLTCDYPATADGALRLLDESYRRWIDGVAALTPDDLARPCGEAEGPYSEYPFVALVLHIHREAIHHLAEILLLRDLYRTRR